MNFTIDFAAFLASLPYMGKGMLGIFIVTAIIVVFVKKQPYSTSRKIDKKL
mgnify:CR=1 FL=1